MLIDLIYGSLALIAFFSALMVVLSPHAVYSALYLVMSMASVAGLFVMMNAQLAAAFQIIVYAGAIMVLFLFVIMLLNVARQEVHPPKTRAVRWIGLLLALAFVAQLAAMVGALAPANAYTLEGAQSIQIRQVARLIVIDYIYAFEMTSLLLLIAVIGAVVLARRVLLPPSDDDRTAPLNRTEPTRNPATETFTRTDRAQRPAPALKKEA